MHFAFKIKYFGPSAVGRPATLIFSSPRSRKVMVIPRDLNMPAEQQAQKLAEATLGFIAFGQLTPSEWVYIVTTKGGN